MKKGTKQLGSVAALSITALAVAAGASLADSGPQTHVNGDFSSGTDFLKTTYKTADGSVDVFLKLDASGVDLKMVDANGTTDKQIAGETTVGADAFYKFVKRDGAEFFLKFQDGGTLDFLFHKAEGGGVVGSSTFSPPPSTDS